MAGEKMEIKTSTPSGVSSDSKLWSALSYVFPILMLIIVYVMEDKKKDKFLFFHAWQSALLAIPAWFLLGWICFPVSFLIMLYFGYRAYQGEKFLLPVIGEFAEKQMK